jgi:hypothetical protein
LLLALLSSLSPTTSFLRNSRDAVTDKRKGDAHSDFQVQFLILWGFEGEFLHKGSEENKQLRPG